MSTDCLWLSQVQWRSGHSHTPFQPQRPRRKQVRFGNVFPFSVGEFSTAFSFTSYWFWQDLKVDCLSGRCSHLYARFDKCHSVCPLWLSCRAAIPDDTDRSRLGKHPSRRYVGNLVYRILRCIFGCEYHIAYLLVDTHWISYPSEAAGDIFPALRTVFLLLGNSDRNSAWHLWKKLIPQIRHPIYDDSHNNTVFDFEKIWFDSWKKNGSFLVFGNQTTPRHGPVAFVSNGNGHLYAG